MGEQITNAEWEKISPDNFETASLLRAVDAIDDLRGDFNDGESSAPPQIRTDLLRLHEIAMAVINEGSRSRVSALFELASDLDEQISHLVNRQDEVQDTLSQLRICIQKAFTTMILKAMRNNEGSKIVDRSSEDPVLSCSETKKPPGKVVSSGDTELVLLSPGNWF